MGVDTSIYANLLRTPKSVAEYDAEAMQGKQNKLALMMNQQKYDKNQRSIERTNGLNSLLGSFKPDMSTEDQVGALTRGGHIDEGRKLAESHAKVNKDKRETEKAELEGHMKKFELAGQIMGHVKDQATWNMAKQQTAQMFGPEAAAQMPDQYDPQLVEQKRMQAMAVKEQVAARHQELVRDLSERKFTYDQTNDTANRNTTIRGQNMTASTAAAGRAQSERASLRNDDRARDFNGTRTEENRLKREQKDDVANMTKASQVASFDTMLGTLDRLSKHGGLSKSVGIAGKFPTMPGSQSANFQAELDTFQSQAFIPMVSQLKGMGALSDAEGRKLTAAVGALNPNMGEAAFRDSIARITTDMDAAKKRVTGTKAAPAKNGGAIPAGWSVKEN